MDQDLLTLIWLGLGLLLIVGELVIPGLVVVFFGVAAVLVSGLRYIGVIEGLIASLFVWAGISFGLILTVRGLAQKYLPSETGYGSANEALQAIGAVVEIIEDVHEDRPTGRIRYQGTSWPAVSTKGTLFKGTQVQLLARDNLAWLVAPMDALPMDNEALPAPDVSAQLPKSTLKDD